LIEGRLSVRPLELNDIENVVDYFLNADDDFLIQMGADRSKFPSREEWMSIIESNYYLSPDKKSFFYIIWLLDGNPVGHSNINKIVFREEAYMHLHLWQNEIRQKGIGLDLLKMTLPYYFNIFKLKMLYCEPSALNPAPNKTLKKLGFDFVKSYETIPGWINFHQQVNRWCLSRAKYRSLYET
jgi:RimJ/RimL family protein N-acetyltransferase